LSLIATGQSVSCCLYSSSVLKRACALWLTHILLVHVCIMWINSVIQISTNIINNSFKFANREKVLTRVEVVQTLQDSVKAMEAMSDRFDGFVFSMKNGRMLTSYDDARMFTEDYPRKARENWVCLTVSDFGSGIKKVSWEKCSSHAQKVGEATVGSTVQDLACICVSLCHQLGGYVACFSTSNVGTTFHVGILVEVVHSDESILGDESEANRSGSWTFDGAIPLRSSILINDDNKVNLNLLHLWLKRELKKARKHVDVVTADGGEAAVDMYKKLLPSVVIIDYHMPGMNGLEATKVIRKYEEDLGLQSSYILSYTADLSTEANDLLLSSGANSIMTKPPPTEFIPELVRRMEMSTKTNVMQNYSSCVDSGESNSSSS